MLTPSFVPEKQRILKEAMTWFVQFQSEQCDPHQREQFETWLAASENHRRAYQEAEKVWSNLDNLKQLPSTNIQAARNVKRNDVAPLVPTLLLIMALLGGWGLDYSAETLTYSTSMGERRSIHLADGSQIDLNTASHLSVKISWLRRQVELLEGEALFTVAHQSLKPFTVHTHNLQIRDIGTVFNVRKHPEETIVSVIEGEVTLQDKYHWLAESLKAGFSRQLDHEGHLLTIEHSNTQKITSWLDGNLIFEHTPLKQVTSEIERYHPVHFIIADNLLSKQTLSGTFACNDLNLFLKAIEKTLPLRAIYKGENIILSRR